MLPPSLKQGNGRVGIGSMCGFTMEHHLYIYHLYQRNPSRQLLGYVKKMKTKFGITISERFMSRWFKKIGPFKGTLRLTSKFPPAKDSFGNRLSSYTNISFSSPLWIITDWYLSWGTTQRKGSLRPCAQRSADWNCTELDMQCQFQKSIQRLLCHFNKGRYPLLFSGCRWNRRHYSILRICSGMYSRRNSTKRRYFHSR